MKPLAILLVLVTALSDASRAVHAADAPPLPRADLPASIRPNPEWTAQAAKDAKQDFTSIPFDGITPNKLACDTTLRELPDGSWVMIMLGGGDTEPRPENHVLLTRSHDRGKTWSPMQPLDFGFPREGDTIAMVPSELMVHAGRCTLFFATHDGTFAGWKEWMSHSEDSCRTWSKPEPAPGRLHDRTFIRNHIVTRDGRILLPFQHYLDAPSCRNPRNGVLMSADGGTTWTEHGNIRISNDDRYQGWAENNIVELGDGRIAMIIRADGYTHRELAGALYYAESKDGGRTWPEIAVKSDIPNPGTKATLYPLGGDTVALLHNPNPKGRHPLALWISFDGMKTWPYQRVLVEHSSDGPGRSLNYPDGFVSKDKQWLHFAYDDNRHRAVHYSARLPPLEPNGAGTNAGGMLERRGLPRVLFNNDSDDLKFAAYPETHGALWVPAGELVPRREITSVDDYLSFRIGPLAKTTVSGLSYCGNFGAPVWDLRRDHVAALGEDPLQPILGFWRRDGRRFFFSMRMNDKHHAWFNWPHLWDEFRRTHRHWFLGPPTEAEWTHDFLPWLNDPTKPGSTEFIAKVTTHPQKLRRASPHSEANCDALLYDYSKPDVRSHYLDVLREACSRYDIDGVELDWLRYPRFFREGEVDAAVITAFVRDARSILDEAATRRGHPLRLVTRVPDSPGSARRIGLDVEAWLEAGWIDAVIAGHGFTFTSNELDQWVVVAHRHHVPVYGVLERMPRGFARYGTPETLRAAAATLWARGADGLYLFNFVNTAEYPLLADLADPARLALRPKEFFLDACWVTDNGTVSKPPLPLLVQPGSPARATLFLTDDPAHATELELELAWKGADEFAAPDVVVNGQKLGGEQLGSQKIDGLRLDRGKAAFAAVSAVRLEKGETPLTVSCSSASLANVFRRGANECVFTSTSDATLTALGLKLTPAPSTYSRAPR